MMSGRPLVLTILDGWGYSAAVEGNAIAAARKPNYDALIRDYPHTLVQTSGPFVGLPDGQMGNSEVGHLNIGSGRIIHMDVTRIDLMIASGDLYRDPTLLAAMHNARGGRLHLFGLLSDGGGHSMNTHLYALIDSARAASVPVVVHAFLDGRDVQPGTALGYVRALEGRKEGGAVIGTVSGRYWAMDRDNRWERVEKAYQAIALGAGERFPSAEQAVRHYYDNPIEPNMSGDEFVTPSIITSADGSPRAMVQANDSVIFYNYRG